MVAYTDFLTTDSLSQYEDSDKYTKEWVPLIEKYRSDLAAATPEELKVKLPKDFDALVEEQFNPLEYLYSEKLLTPEEFALTDSSASSLASRIAAGELTAVQVFKAFSKRAVIAHQFTNCAMDFFIDEGLKRAEYLDEYFKKNGKTVGPLHGVPVSLKEHMNYKNRITHGGYVSLLKNVPKTSSATVQILEDLGAVYYIRTTQPQTLMHLDSANNISGLTRNPYNMSLSSGGSSSGEGAVVAFGGSALGVGSDIGGSIRGPAAFSGCIGLRPTSKRVSLNGGVSSGAGQESVPAVIGPFARTVEDIDLWMKSYVNEGKPWLVDPNSLPMPWRPVEAPDAKSLTIAVMYDDGNVRPSPAVTRGLNFTVEKLKAAGVNVVEFKPIRTKEAYETVHKMYNCDGNYMQRKLLAASGEPLVKLTKWSLNYGNGEKNYTVKENRELNVIRDSLKQDYNDFLLQNKIDFILSPTYNNAAPRSEEVFNWSYTSLFNILDFPTLVFQTGLKQDPKIDVWPAEAANYTYRSELEKLENENYIPENFINAPIGLQLSGRRYFDEEVVAAGKTIVQILGADLLKH
ncbi:hypothetical protein G9P44_005059 [Scheffersomyces stipitis]|nr:hypothetical protein G9P44_005059 [Scheffersomyces stipitis]